MANRYFDTDSINWYKKINPYFYQSSSTSYNLMTEDDPYNKALRNYVENDVKCTNELIKKYVNERFCVPKYMTIEKVIFNNPATIVIWADGTKTVVKAKNEVFDPEKGLAMAISKKFFGNKGNYFNVFKKWIPEANAERRKLEVARAKSLHEDGKSLNEIAKIMGYANDSSVRSLLNENSEARMNQAQKTAFKRRELYDDVYFQEAYIDAESNAITLYFVGPHIEICLGMENGKFDVENVSVEILKKDGSNCDWFPAKIPDDIIENLIEMYKNIVIDNGGN